MLHLHFQVADSTSGDTKEAQQDRDKRREDNELRRRETLQEGAVTLCIEDPRDRGAAQRYLM